MSHRVLDVLFAEGAPLRQRTQPLLQRVLRVLVGQSAALAQHGERVSEPTFVPDQRADPGLGADAAAQRL